MALLMWVTTRDGLEGKYRQRVGGISCLHLEGRLYAYSSGDFNVTMATECFLETLVTIYQTRRRHNIKGYNSTASSL
jgi:hypothetical protein